MNRRIPLQSSICLIFLCYSLFVSFLSFEVSQNNFEFNKIKKEKKKHQNNAYNALTYMLSYLSGNNNNSIWVAD